MAERKTISAFSEVTDTETGQEKIGDIEGGNFDTEWLKSHLKNRGPWELLKVISFMCHQISITSEKSDYEVESDLDVQSKYELAKIMNFGSAYHDRILRKNLRRVKSNKPEEKA